MSHIRRNVLSDEELNYLNNIPEVIEAKASLDSTASGMVYFSVPVTDLIRDTLQSQFDLCLSTGSSIPMRWIKGDTAPHVDVGLSNFKNTYLLYLNDSPGELVIESQSYPIEANTGFVFNEGMYHETKYTGNVARLLLGPMNEFAEPVGAPLAYFPTEADALANTNNLGYSGSFTVGDGGPFGGYTIWRIASNSTGTSPQNITYTSGNILNTDGGYNLYHPDNTRYYIQLTLPDVSNAIIFTGFFEVDNSSNIVQTFYDITNPTVNIRSTGNNGGPTYLYNPGWLCFDGGGCNVTSFPYLYGATSGDYNLYGSTSSSTGNSVDDLGNVTYEFSLTIAITYYANEADALANTNPIGYTWSFVVGDGGPFGGYTSWRLASNSTGTSPQNVVYADTASLNSDGLYYLYPPAPCFLEGSKILCLVDGVETYIPVEQLKKGILVKTSLDGYKAVVLIGKGTILNPGNDERTENRLYKCSPNNYPQLKEDLYITGCHSILVSTMNDKQKENTITHLGRMFVTDKKYRLMACLDESADPWNSEGLYTIWHFALENKDERMNYGVYANGGLLVESCSIIFLRTKSNMEYIE